MCIFQSGVGGAPAADSRFAVPCPTGHERAPKSAPQHVPTVTGKFEGKIGSYLKHSFFGFLLAPKVAVTKLAKSGLAIFANFSRFNNFPKLFGCLTTLLFLGTARNYQTV